MNDRIKELIAQTKLRYNEHQNVQWRTEELTRLIQQVAKQCADIAAEMQAGDAEDEINERFGIPHEISPKKKISQLRQVIEVSDWDELVQKTYGRPYSFQQQDDCKGRGIETIAVPCNNPYDYKRDTIPEVVNGPQMGVSFAAWLARDPKQKLNTEDKWDRDHGLDLFWERNFYPHVDMVANDLHAKGLLPAGTYDINIDW